MPEIDLSWVNTAFQGGQFAVVVFILMQIRELRRDHVRLNVRQDRHDKAIGKLNTRLAFFMGKMGFPFAEDDKT